MLSFRSWARRSFAVRILENSADAVEDIRNGSRIAVGGYGSCGVPENSLRALHALGTYDHTVFTATSGLAGWGLDPLLKAKQIRRLVTSYPGSNASFQRMYYKGEVELMVIPSGSLAARMYAGGAGIPAIYTKTGVGTIIEEGNFPIKYMPGGRGVEIYSPAKEKRRFHNKTHILEEAITVDFALVKAWKADTMGNLVLRRTSANFNVVMAQCARVTIAEVEEIVPQGQLDPDDIHIPAVYVHSLYKGEYYEKPVENINITSIHNPVNGKNTLPAKLRIARRAAKELEDGMTAHLAVGLPGLVAQFIDPSSNVMLHTESGALGIGKYSEAGNEDPDVVNTGRKVCSLVPGSSCFSSNEAMDMLRGGHIDVNIVNGFQVSQTGDLANWLIPGKYSAGLGGSMDVTAGDESRVIVTMLHTTEGNPKILKECTLPLTGRKCVDLLITELAVFDFNREDTLVLTEIAKGVQLSDIKEATDCSFLVASDLKPMPS